MTKTEKQIQSVKQAIEKRLDYIQFCEKLGSTRDVEISGHYLAEDERKLRRLVNGNGQKAHA